KVDAPIQQGLADGDPDVDAVFRMTRPLPVEFRSGISVALGEHVWCPFNSQNTTWFRDAFPLLYLPSYCSFRMTDIWRSFVAQRVAWANGWNIIFDSPTVWQDRNEHDLLKDFELEIPGYLHNARIAEALDELTLPGGVHAIGDAMTRCYDLLIEMGLVGERERELLRLWLDESGARLA
ncbi:MAG: STELLO glycosyltransferase family protein, partial [Acidimicrobiia bacterium]|nr:STELLO glycosyltransferase family protein [Acidimicrobiia bacterium]